MPKEFVISAKVKYILYLIGMLFIIVFVLISFIGRHTIEGFLLLLVLIFAFCFTIYIYQKGIKNELLIFSFKGIKYVNTENREVNVSWNKISSIILGNEPFNGHGFFIKVLFIDKRNPLVIQCGRASFLWINFYVLRRKIVFFSNKKHLLIVKSKQWYFKLL